MGQIKGKLMVSVLLWENDRETRVAIFNKFVLGVVRLQTFPEGTLTLAVLSSQCLHPSTMDMLAHHEQ